MNVKLYVPRSAPVLDGQRALMITLHGCIQTASALATSGNWTATADAYGMVVAAPDAPNGGVIAGCWDYYDTNHSSSNPSRHDDNLIQLAETLIGRSELTIDPDQVYVSGLSSGGGQAMVMGCLRPDLFAGMGLNAGPTVGTTSGQIGSVASDLAKGRRTCTTFAGSNASDFSTQLTSVVYGDNDTVVAPGYNRLNAEIMASIYGASSKSSFSLSSLAGNNTAGSGTLYEDALGSRVSLIQNTGLGHNWPAGAGTGGSYISADSIDYPAYLTDFFFDNNRRVDGDRPEDKEAPTVSVTSPADGATVTGDVDVTATASDDVGVTRVELLVDGVVRATDSTAPYAFTWDTAGNGGTRTVAARAYDAAGKSATSTVTVTVDGPVTPQSYCGTATNAEHKAAGRAISYGVHPYNPYYAVGSQAYLGQGDATRSTLKETTEGSYSVVTAC
ncbi:PHB depolymerase family esterase [Cellulomonas fimi]|nr:PHB depolymerase family esterase [Cellulomonas fimi]